MPPAATPATACAWSATAKAWLSPFAGSGVLRAVANAASLTDALTDGPATDDALRRWSETQLQVAAQVIPNVEAIERSYVFGLPDLTAMPTTATNSWLSAAFPGLEVTLPDAALTPTVPIRTIHLCVPSPFQLHTV